jgi:hypothetical protein
MQVRYLIEESGDGCWDAEYKISRVYKVYK